MTDTAVEPEIKDPKAVLDALERAKADARKYREQAEGLQEQVSSLTTERDKLKESLDSDEWRNKVRDLSIRQALKDQGHNPDRVMKYLSLDGISLDEEGKLSGLDESLATVKKDLPELFDPKRRVGGAADLFEKGDVDTKKTGSQTQVARLLNRSA